MRDGFLSLPRAGFPRALPRSETDRTATTRTAPPAIISWPAPAGPGGASSSSPLFAASHRRTGAQAPVKTVELATEHSR